MKPLLEWKFLINGLNSFELKIAGKGRIRIIRHHKLHVTTRLDVPILVTRAHTINSDDDYRTTTLSITHQIQREPLSNIPNEEIPRSRESSTVFEFKNPQGALLKTVRIVYKVTTSSAYRVRKCLLLKHYNRYHTCISVFPCSAIQNKH